MVERATTARAAVRTFLRRRVDPDARSGLRLTLVAVAFLLVAVSFGLILRWVQDADSSLGRADRSLVDDVHQWVAPHEWLVDALQVVTFFGTGAVLAVVCTAAVVVLRRRGRRRASTFVTVSALLGTLLNALLKGLVERPRPVLDEPIAIAEGWSFPSGHAMGSVICLGVVVVAVGPLLSRGARRRLRWAAAMLATAIALIRVALGVHYLSDVIAGALLGLAWLSLSVVVFAQHRSGPAVSRAVEERTDRGRYRPG